MRTKNLVFSVFTLLLFVSYANAQVTGVVADDLGPVGGALVTVKESGESTETDEDGAFSIDAVIGNSLVIMNPETLAEKNYPITKLNMGKLVITDAAVALEDVISVAYGTADRTTFTGAVSSVGEEQLEKIKSSDVAKSLEGAVSGLSVTNSTGQPGAGTTLRIRGIGSINASNSPLIILDGAPYSGAINSINPFDIKSVDVLKDAASAALYGARGANGVIIITTKKAEKGKLSVNLDMSIGVNDRGVPEYDIMTSPAEYYETYWESIKNYFIFREGTNEQQAAGGASGYLISLLGHNIYNVANNEVVGLDGKINPNAQIKYEDANDFNDWAGKLFAPQLRREYNLGLSQKTNKGSLSFSLGYVSDDGYSQNSYFERYSNRLSFDTELTNWLDLSTSSLLSYTESNWNTSGAAYTNPFGWTRNIAPIYSIYMHDADGKLMRDRDGNLLYDWGYTQHGVNGSRAYGESLNPLATQRLDKSLNTDYYLTQAANLNARILPGLTLSIGGTFSGNWYGYSRYQTSTGGDAASVGGRLRKNTSNILSLNLNQILRYKKSFSDISFEALLGHESYKRHSKNLSAEKQNQLDSEVTEFNYFSQINSLTSYTREYAVEGFFGQITADYLDRYFVSASARRDGSSIFHPDNRWGTFWSTGASWRIDREEFMRDIEAFDFLKLKASYGVQGNDHLLLPGGGRSWTPYNTLFYVDSDVGVSVISSLYKGRKEVTWEESQNMNLGIDFSIYKGLLNLEFDYFNRKTNDLLFNLPIPSSTGFSSEPWNIGDMVNKGVDLTLSTTPINTKNIKWAISINGTSYKNTVLRLPERFRKDGITRGSQKIMEGGSIYDFYMVKWAGVDAETGDALYWIKDDNGEFKKTPSKNYYISNDKYDNRQFVGSALPDFAGGFGTTLDAYGFDLSVQFSYQLGGKVVDSGYGNLMNPAMSAGNNYHRDIKDRWTPENKEANIPRIEYGNRALAHSSDRFLTDASYLSLKSISLGYSFNKNILSSLKLEGLRIYVSSTNTYLWSMRKGLDPRMSISGTPSSAGVYSPIRTILGGLSIKL